MKYIKGKVVVRYSIAVNQNIHRCIRYSSHTCAQRGEENGTRAFRSVVTAVSRP